MMTEELRRAFNEMGWNVGAVLGKGGFGTAYLLNHTSRRQLVAKCVSASAVDPEQAKQQIEQEITIFEYLQANSLKRQNIVRYFGIIPEVPVLLLEFCAGGDLFDAIAKKQFLVETNAEIKPATIFVMMGVTAALEYLHSKKIVWRDLKPENIFLRGKEIEGPLDIAIGDFGSARRVRDVTQLTISAEPAEGTPTYGPREVFRNGQGKIAFYYGSDVWSLGVLLYLMLRLGFPDYCYKNPEGGEELANSEELGPRLRDDVVLNLMLNLKDLPQSMGDILVQIFRQSVQLSGPQGFCLDPNPEQRRPTACELYTMFKALRPAPAPAGEVGSMRRASAPDSAGLVPDAKRFAYSING